MTLALLPPLPSSTLMLASPAVHLGFSQRKACVQSTSCNPKSEFFSSLHDLWAIKSYNRVMFAFHMVTALKAVSC